MEQLKDKFNQDYIERRGDPLRQFNITITFNPSKFSISESWSNRMLEDIKFEIERYSGLFFLIKESMKNYYCHYHGIVYMREEDKIKLYGKLTKKFGLSTVKRNVKDIEGFRRSIGLPTDNLNTQTYFDYCLKDYEENCIKIKDRKILTVIDKIQMGNTVYPRIYNEFK